MRFGIATPVVVQVPGGHGDWEESAGIEALDAIARAADRLGYHHATCSEHVAVPEAAAAVRGGTYWDPLATFGYMAAITTQLKFATNVLVLGYHHPLAIAKRYGTLDAVSGGRVILGLGVGTLEEEFELLDMPFADRGPRADDAIEALRAAWAEHLPTYQGPHYSFGGMVVDPHAVQPRVPIWIGGRTRRSLRRAVTLGDGWVPFALSHADITAMLDQMDVPSGFDVVLGAPGLDPVGDPDAVAGAIAAVAAAGGTVMHVSVKSRSLAHYLEQIAAFADLAGIPPRL
jgi:probable F420-dependent oxidoreductase